MALDLSGEGFQSGALIALFLVQAYCFLGVYANSNETRLRKYRWLGPFALLVSGVLSCRGKLYLLAFLSVSALLLGYASMVFDV